MDRRRVVLIAEDSERDAEVAIQAFKEPPRWQVVWVEDGVAALEVLRHKGKHASTPVPDLLILSIQMPRMRGPEVLCRVKETSGLSGLPVVMWSVCDDEYQIERLYQMGAAAYVAKRVDREEEAEQLRAVRRFWDVAALPQCRAPDTLSLQGDRAHSR